MYVRERTYTLIFFFLWQTAQRASPGIFEEGRSCGQAHEVESLKRLLKASSDSSLRSF